MNYKDMLTRLGLLFGTSEFTTVQAVRSIAKNLSSDPKQFNHPDLLILLSTKRISDYLATLYKMRFLARRRTKRIIKDKNQRSCNRGFEYVYHISNQGISYLKYLANPEESIHRRNLRSVREAQNVHELIYMRDRLPDELKEHFSILNASLFGKAPSRSVERRFPIHRDYEMILVTRKLAERCELFKERCEKIISDLKDILKDNQIEDPVFRKEFCDRIEQALRDESHS